MVNGDALDRRLDATCLMLLVYVAMGGYFKAKNSWLKLEFIDVLIRLFLRLLYKCAKA